MKLVLATLSESASVDVQSNQLSVFNMIENIQVNGTLPVQYPRMTLVNLWERDDTSAVSTEERISCRVKIKSADTTAPIGEEFEVVMQEGQPRVRVIINLIGVPINSVGVNEVIFETKRGNSWHEAGSVSILVALTS